MVPETTLKSCQNAGEVVKELRKEELLKNLRESSINNSHSQPSSNLSSRSRKRQQQFVENFKENFNVTKKMSTLSGLKDRDENEEGISGNKLKRHNKLIEESKDEKIPEKKRRFEEDTTILLKDLSEKFEVAGRVVSVELENFMCHDRFKIDFDVENNNCFYIGGPNGSGKSALFAALNIGLGGRGSCNERGNSVRDYIKEGKNSSKIRIVLTNRGSGRHPQYGPEIAIERAINSSSSSYAIKSVQFGKGGRREELVTARKADLDKLLIRFDIQLNNPIFWMSQDRCRSFLQEMKPDKLYQIFAVATELDYTQQCYIKVEDYIREIRNLMNRLKGDLKEKQSQIMALNAQKEKMKSVDEKKMKLNELGWILIWLGVRDALKEVQRWETALGKANEAVNVLQERIVEYDNNLEVLKNQQQKQNVEAEAYEVRRLDLKKEIEKKNVIVETERKKVLENMQVLKRREQELKEIEAQISSIDHQFQQLQSKLQKNKNGQLTLPNLKEELRLLNEEVKEREKLLEEIEVTCKKYTSDVEAAANFERKALFDMRAVQGELRKVSAEAERMDAMLISDVARFGVEMPAILKLIEDNCAIFRRKPIGPLGFYVKVKQQRWVLAVELALGNVLRCFLCDNAHDRTLLETLLKKNRIHKLPSIIVSKFSDRLYVTDQNEPLASFLTVLRLVVVSDANVFNAIVDQTQMESILLIETDDEARRLMFNNPPFNVSKGFTMNGSEVFPSASGKVYRFYSNQKGAEVRFLTISRDVDKVKLSFRLKELETDLKEAENKFYDAQKKGAYVKAGFSDLKVKMKNLSAELERVLAKRRTLEKKIDFEEVDENADEHILNLLSSKQEFFEKKTMVESAIEEVQKEVTVCKQTYVDAQADKKTVEVELRNLDITLQKIMHKNNALLAEWEKINDCKKGIENDISKLFAKKDEFNIQLKSARTNYEKSLEATKKCSSLPCPKGISNPPNLEELPDSEATQTEYKSLEEFINAAKKCLGSALITMESLKKLTAEFRTTRERYRQLARLLKKLEACLALRRDKYLIIRHAIALRLIAAYSRLMAMRNFRGHLILDHEKRNIEITADTHRKHFDGESVSVNEASAQKHTNLLQDLRGLSGGERTYTMACFIMALWETMDSPFRCMDEFDVFLDLNNRKLVMELLVELATQHYPHNQFIFFTPQGVTELTKKERVQLFEMPKVRPQLF